MWKEYSKGYLKNNRASGISVVIAAFISALLLSLLGSLFYNLWVYEVEQLKAEEGDWQGRLVGEVSIENLERIQKHANVARAVINEELTETSGGEEMVIDLYFERMRHIFTDLPQIAELAELPAEAVSYHYALLNLYLIRSSEDTALRWVFPFALAVVGVACLSLILVIHNAFAVSMNARIHQFAIFSSIGATPAQIRSCLLQEAFALCMVPVGAGSLLGILLGMGILEVVNMLLADVEGRMELPFCYHPLLLALTVITAAVTLWVSAWIPARRMSRLTPLEAIRNTGELQLKRKKHFPVLSLLFGMEGELAGSALKALRKAMRTATLSLVLSFLAFSFLMCFLTLTIVSQQETYFARYQDAWDVMATVKHTDIDAFDKSGMPVRLQVPGVKSCVAYQKAAATRFVKEEELGEEMRETGALENAKAEYVTPVSGGWIVNAPLVILDDAGFLEYCEQIGKEPRLDGAVVLNQASDAADPNFRQRRRFPYLSEESRTTALGKAALQEKDAWKEEGFVDSMIRLPVTAYTQEPPVLREEYGTLDFYELVHFIPASVWQEVKDEIGGAEEDISVRILVDDRGIFTEQEKDRQLEEAEAEVLGILGPAYETETENRLEELHNNERMFVGMKAIISIFCILLAMIGIGNVFTNTLGFVRQRKREFARYLSVGLTPGGMWKVFCVEALVIAGRLVLIALPVTVAGVAFFIRASYLEPMVFVRDAPFLSIFMFVLALFVFVGLAYYLGAKKVFGSGLADALRDDTMI